MTTRTSTMYFDEFKTGVSNAWHVVCKRSAFSGLPPVELPSTYPAGQFRVAVTISPVEDHTTTTGQVVVSGGVLTETISFTSPARRVTTMLFTAPITISTVDLDCNIEIEYVSETGEPIYFETLEKIEIIYFPRTRLLRDNALGGYMQTEYDIYTETHLPLGAQIRFKDPHQGNATVEVYVKARTSAVDLEYHTQPFWLYNCA